MSFSKFAIGTIISRARRYSPSFAQFLPRLSNLSLPFAPQQLRLSQAQPPLWYNHVRVAMPLMRAFHDGRPRGPLWRGKKLIGKEALYVIMGLKRFKNDEEKLEKFIKTHVLRLLKMDMITALTELERQEEVSLAVKIFKIIQKQEWYKSDVFLYKDLIISLSRSRKMEEALELWEMMRKEDLFPDSQTYTEVIRGFLRYGSPGDAMNIYEDMKKSPEPPEELPFRVLLKGLLPHPLLRNRVKQDFEEIFPDRHIYDPPEEIFGLR